MAIGMMISGVLFGLCSAMLIWQGGHHPAVIGLAYMVGGMIGVLGFAGLFAPPQKADSASPH
jgi:hypothetical protein